MAVGENAARLDARDKVRGVAEYSGDSAPRDCLVAKVLHATIANGWVESIDTASALALPGVWAVVTCFDVPELPIATACNPWTKEPAHRDVEDRLLLNRRVRCYGDDIAAVVAEDDLTAERALAALRVTYQELPAAFTVEQALAVPGGVPIHAEFPDNVLARSQCGYGDFAAAIAQPGLTRVEGWYETKPVQHVSLENPISYAYEQGGRLTVVSSTQCPHILRRIIAQALGLPWGQVRVVKPYIGGGFGNKTDALYEPLNAFLCQQVGGHCVKLELTREEDFSCTRSREAIRYHLVTYAKADGTFVARSLECQGNQGAYASHGHAVTAKGLNAFRMLYRSQAVQGEALSVYTNLPTCGAMRGYGVPQVTFAMESHLDDVARALGLDPLEVRLRNRMEPGYHDELTSVTNYTDSLGQCVAKGRALMDYDAKRAAYTQPQSGPFRRGVGASLFWYKTGVHPFCLEASTCHMLLNQDGSLQLLLPEPEIGQGADTVFAQMAADTIGLPLAAIQVVSCQDTDVVGYGSGAYASRQTYVGGMVIYQTGLELKARILEYAAGMIGRDAAALDIRDGNVISRQEGEILLSVGQVAEEAVYSMERSQQLAAESTYQCKTNALSLGCCFAEVEVDVPLCRVRVLRVLNVHDCGRLINPQLAAGQVHGGISMALGFALSEKLLYDKAGRPLNGNMLDYKLLTAMDHPEHLETAFVENPEPTSPFGVKALGEPPALAAAAAIRNAVLQATGVAMDALPLDPPECFRRFRQAGLLEELSAGRDSLLEKEGSR